MQSLPHACISAVLASEYGGFFYSRIQESLVSKRQLPKGLQPMEQVLHAGLHVHQKALEHQQTDVPWLFLSAVMDNDQINKLVEIASKKQKARFSLMKDRSSCEDHPDFFFGPLTSWGTLGFFSDERAAFTFYKNISLLAFQSFVHFKIQVDQSASKQPFVSLKPFSKDPDFKEFALVNSDEALSGFRLLKYSAVPSPRGS